MKKIILITLIFLLHSFPSFGNPQSKGLVCKWSDTKLVKKDRHERRVIGFYFDTMKTVKSYYFREKGEKLILEEIQSSWTSTVNVIQWFQKEIKPNPYDMNDRKEIIIKNILDRKTLKLKREVDYESNDPIKVNLNCKIELDTCGIVNDCVTDSSKFVEYLEKKYKPKYQTELLEILVKNKI